MMDIQVFSCKVCNVTVNSRDQLSFHEQGKSHQKKLQLQAQQNLFRPSTTSQLSTSSRSSNYGSELDSGLFSPSTVSGLDQVLNLIPTYDGRYDTAPTQNFERPLNLGPNCVRCEVCNIWANTEEVLMKHKDGKDHQKKLQKLSVSNQMSQNSSMSSQNSLPATVQFDKSAVMVDANNQLWCKICNIYCNTAEQLAIHMGGKQHAKKASQQAALKSFGRESFRQAPERSFTGRISEKTESIRDDESDLFGPRSTRATMSGGYGVNTGSPRKTLPPEETDWRQNEVVQLTKNASRSIYQRPNDPFEDQFAIPASGCITFENITVPQGLSSHQKGISTSIFSSDNIQSSHTTSSPQVVASRSKSESCFDVAVKRGYVRPVNQDFQCDICNSVSNTKEQMLVHLGGKKHIQKLKRQNFESETTELHESHSPNQQMDPDMEELSSRMGQLFGSISEPEVSEAMNQRVLRLMNGLYFCNVCEYQLPPNNVLSHLKGKIHMNHFTKNIKIPANDTLMLKPIRKALSPDPMPQMQLYPRSYQREVYGKGLRDDCIIFMPTGTGKTLVACMLIAKMLDENPGRQVVFLVDKVLLVIQQAGVLRDQLQDITVARCEDRFVMNSRIVTRKIRIAALCGDYVDLNETVPLFHQDILVVTAAYYQNLLENQSVSWSHLCLVIFDEAHHCTKDHPYNKLIINYHRPSCKSTAPSGSQCKIVGLTASPAGALSANRTKKRLEDLLLSMGNLKMVSVMDFYEELLQYIPKVRVEPRLVEFLPHELQLRNCYINYLFELFKRKFNDYAPQVVFKLKSLVDNCFTHSGSGSVDMSSEQLDNLNNIIRKFKFLCSEEHDEMTQKFHIFLDHYQHIILQMMKLDSIGWLQMKEEVRYLLGFPSTDRETTSSFESLGRLDSQCGSLIELLKLRVKTIENASNQNFSVDLTSIARELLREIKNVRTSYSSEKALLILVLAKERSLPWSLQEYLKNETDLSVAALVGHGTTSGEARGMTVQQQRKELENIKKSKYQVIVATPVAEEGIDLPSCDLVILLNPPTSVQALVQMRGRARKLKSRFLIFCREPIEVDQIQQLEKREEHMIRAANEICQEQDDF